MDLNIRKIIKYFIITILVSIYITTTIIFFFMYLYEPLYRIQEKIYYSNINNYVTEKAIIESIPSNQRVVWIDFVGEGDYAGFVIRGDSVAILMDNGLREKVMPGTEITYTYAPRVFGDGYVRPIVAITVGDEVLLGFEEGYENLMEQYKLRLFEKD